MTPLIYAVTLADLRKAGACYEGYNKVVRMLQGEAFSEEDAERESYIKYNHDELISLLDIAKNNGLDDALWCLRCVPDCDRDARLFAVWCARQVEHLMTDRRSKDALGVAERFANGEATEKELDAAYAAAYAASATYWNAGNPPALLEMFTAMCEGRALWQSLDGQTI